MVNCLFCVCFFVNLCTPPPNLHLPPPGFVAPVQGVSIQGLVFLNPSFILVWHCIRYRYDYPTVRTWVQQTLDGNHDGRLSREEVRRNLKRILDSGEGFAPPGFGPDQAACRPLPPPGTCQKSVWLLSDANAFSPRKSTTDVDSIRLHSIRQTHINLEQLCIDNNHIMCAVFCASFLFAPKPLSNNFAVP